MYAENKRIEEEMSMLQDANQQMQSQLEYQHNMLTNMQTELDYYRSMYSTNDTPQPEINLEKPTMRRTDTASHY